MGPVGRFGTVLGPGGLCGLGAGAAKHRAPGVSTLSRPESGAGLSGPVGGAGVSGSGACDLSGPVGGTDLSGPGEGLSGSEAGDLSGPGTGGLSGPGSGDMS